MLANMRESSLAIMWSSKEGSQGGAWSPRMTHKVEQDPAWGGGRVGGVTAQLAGLVPGQPFKTKVSSPKLACCSLRL